MKAKRNRDVVDFITIDDGDDLMVSFAIGGEEPGDIVTLILLRTPKYEPLLPEDERGVSVSHEADSDDEEDLLQSLRLAGSVITIESTRKQYELDVSQVDRQELKAARKVLTRMNFDNRFVLEL